MDTEWISTHWLAVVLLLAYTLVLFYNAYRGSQASASLDGYYVGGRNLGGFAIGVSFFATFASTNSYIGHAGKGYDFGLPWLVLAITLVIFCWLSWRWVAPGLRRFASAWDALTLPDYLGARFAGEGEDRPGHPIRVCAALIIVFSSILYLIAIFKGAGHLFEMFLGVSYTQAIFITLMIVMLYTSIGGFVSVVRTDVLQGSCMLVGSVLMFYFVTQAAGGVGAMGELSQRPDKDWLFELNAGIPFVVLLGISLSGAMKLLVDPRQLSRFYALKDDRQLKLGMWIAFGGLIVVFGCLFPIGVYSHLILDNVQDTDRIVPTLVADPTVFPIWAGDFLIVAIVAAAMSSMDSVLLVAASTLDKNLIAPAQRTRIDQPGRVKATRLGVIGFAVVSAVLALNPPGDIVQITIFSGSLYAVCFFPAVVIGLHWQKGNAQAVLWSMGVGTLTLMVWLLLDWNSVLHEVFPALLGSLCAYVSFSVNQPAAIGDARWQIGSTSS
ncbi:MAG: sodium/solute symporter [Pseudomonadota bacterium]